MTESELLKLSMVLKLPISLTEQRLFPKQQTGKSKWNKLKSQEIIVINCHAMPTSMSCNLTKSVISKLNKLKCKLLILLGCNAGHYDYLWNNVAYEFSKKISGTVVASDGTVYSSDNNKYLKFASKNDSAFKKYCKTKRNNYGWVIYRKGIWYSTPYKTMNFYTIVSYLKKCKLYG